MSRIAILVVCLGLLLVGCGGSSPPDSPLAHGREIYGNVCSTCHGSTGMGGVGPSLSQVLVTWPSCSDHMEWISLGSNEWKKIHGDTYGANDAPVKGNMPKLSASLTPEEITLVAAFERITFGREEESEAYAECGVDTSVYGTTTNG
jgi:mono/diheme cytochrome c family protein